VVSALAPVEYVAATRAKLDAAAAAAGRPRPELVTLVAVNLTADESKAQLVRDQLKPVLAFYIAATGPGPLFGAVGANEQVADMIARGGFETVMAEMPDEWIDAVAIAGGVDRARTRIRAYLDAGSDTVVVATVVPEGTDSSLVAVRTLVDEFPA
jgi:alkanesulfonate monooxygenase SsuD/methylene tetrahydromethanopterin reductase-like flavin-dependent oxidoreductase (luciferase family)